MRKNRKFFRMILWLIMVIFAFSTSRFGTMKAEQSDPNTYLPLVQKARVIDFDEHSAPCIFADTTALRDEYMFMGVRFSAPQPLDGGGILNQCGYFEVFGYSPPNFLAFNRTAQYSDGGIPTPPQIIMFINLASSIRFDAGSKFVGSSLTLIAYDADDHKLAESSISLTPTLQTVAVNATGIQYVVIDCTAENFVIDDLSWR